MNVYQKVLTKIYDITGGKDSVDVDLVDLTKKEGFYSNIDNISKQLQDEGWISEGSRTNIIRITHWGASEAKRVLSASPDKVNELSKESNRLAADAKEFAIMLEEFVTGPDPQKIGRIEDRISEMSERCRRIKSFI
jgi:hypothetical protein